MHFRALRFVTFFSFGPLGRLFRYRRHKLWPAIGGEKEKEKEQLFATRNDKTMNEAKWQRDFPYMPDSLCASHAVQESLVCGIRRGFCNFYI